MKVFLNNSQIFKYYLILILIISLKPIQFHNYSLNFSFMILTKLYKNK